MLYVVRHGETDWNKEKLTMGRKDVPLNDKGREQAIKTRENLYDVDIDLIICSPLLRAKETAKIIKKHRNIDIKIDERLIERGLGDLEGKPYTGDNDRLWDININIKEYNIEPMRDLRDRVDEFLNYIQENYKNKNILVVTHGGISAMINAYLNDTLYDGPISDKFLKNCEVAQYEINQKIK